MLPGTEVPTTGKRTRRRVDAEFQSLAVEPVTQGFHIGELGIGYDLAFFIALRGFPAIIDVLNRERIDAELAAVDTDGGMEPF